MKIKTQIRRTLMSLAALAAFGTVAIVHGESRAVAGNGAVLTANCPDAEAEALPAMVRAVEPVRVDWRVRVPATIARSRS